MFGYAWSSQGSMTVSMILVAVLLQPLLEQLLTVVSNVIYILWIGLWHHRLHWL